MKIILFVIPFCILGLVANAHPMPNSILTLSVQDTQINGKANLPLIELITALKTENFDKTHAKGYYGYFRSHIQAQTDQRKWVTKIDSITFTKEIDPKVGEYQEATLFFHLLPASLADLRQFDLQFDVISHQVITHKTMVLIDEDWQEGLSREDVPEEVGIIGLDVPSGTIPPIHVDLKKANWWSGFMSMVKMGMDHIREGLDHILFLLSLLLIAPLAGYGNRWSGFQGTKYTFHRFLKISLMFTIGHSLSLVLGAYNLIPFNLGYIEVLIALTITVSAIHAMVPLFQQKESWIGLCFGFIHGLAFSESITSLSLSPFNKALSILGFNLGIEMMQIIIMLVVLPVLLLSKFRMYTYLRISFALVTIILSIFWIQERMMTLF